MIAVLDYGSGNIRSVQRACEKTGLATTVTSDLDLALQSQGLVVPGVGAFAACMSALRKMGGERVIAKRIEENRPVLGICVGMQILFRSSDEDQNKTEGLGYFSGAIRRLKHGILPQIGWNNIDVGSGTKIFSGIEKERFYFVHSFAAVEDESGAITTRSEHGSTFIAGIEKGPVSAVQFHPEKSGDAGLQLIRNWAASI